jgi:hypothetical protein
MTVQVQVCFTYLTDCRLWVGVCARVAKCRRPQLHARRILQIRSGGGARVTSRLSGLKAPLLWEVGSSSHTDAHRGTMHNAPDSVPPSPHILSPIAHRTEPARSMAMRSDGLSKVGTDDCGGLTKNY